MPAPRRRGPRADRVAAGATRGALAALALWLWVAGCATSDYHDAQRDWTRSEESYTNFEGQAFVHATLKTEPFRRAYVAEYARVFALTAEQREALAEAERAEAESSLVVIAAFYTASPRWNDLNPVKGLWEVRLEGAAGRVARPRRVWRLSTHDPAWRHLYPYADPHYVLYELTFDRRAEGGGTLDRPGEELALVIAGAPARLRVSWVVP